MSDYDSMLPPTEEEEEYEEEDNAGIGDAVMSQVEALPVEKRAWNCCFLVLQPYLECEFKLVHNQTCDMLIPDEEDPMTYWHQTGPHGKHNFILKKPSFEAEFYYYRGDRNKGTKNIKFEKARWLSRMLGRNAYLGRKVEPNRLDMYTDCPGWTCMMILLNPCEYDPPANPGCRILRASDHRSKPY